METCDNNVVSNDTGLKKSWLYVAHVEDYRETMLQIFFNEKEGKVFLEDSTHYGRHISEVQRLFDEKIKPELEKEKDCWESFEDGGKVDSARINAFEAYSAGAVRSIKDIENPGVLVDEVVFSIGVHSLQWTPYIFKK